MNESGYSGTPLVKKLGLKPGTNYAIHTPTDYLESLDLAADVMLAKRITPAADFAQAFYTSKARLESGFAALKASLRSTGQLWICWPKATSKMETDLNANVVREIGLAGGLVDVKVAAIDDDWSGLKFVYRTKDR